MKTQNYTYAVGRRKEAVARIRFFKGVSPILINDKNVSEYFKGPLMQKMYQYPLEITQTVGQYTGTIKVIGGGRMSQLGAVVHGIARALAAIDKDKFRIPLKKAGLLTRDPRVKERRKFGLAHKARAKKQSPKR